ncbi:MAG: hypothetical protein GWP02_08715 [Desulfobulbaceae bacterium]|nr:hypothetical protein [Desulfobulbaceae bacterium]
MNEPRYASVAGIMKARRKPVEEVTCQELGVDAQPAVKIVALEPVVVERTCIRVRDAAELLNRLRHDSNER